MTMAIVFGILAAFLYGVTNHIDKFMISGIDSGKDTIKVLLVFSTFVAGIILIPVWLILSKFNIVISLTSLISILVAAIVYIIAVVFYFKAMEENDTSIVVVMFQMIPVFSYTMALILFKENLTIKQIIGAFIILLSTILISINFGEKNNKKRLKAFAFMTLSSFLCAVYCILFDIGIRNSSYYSCVFWYQIGLLLIGIIFLCIKGFRVPFIKAVKNNGKRYLFLNITNETINLVANALFNFANLTAPVALLNVLNGFQGAFAFILGVLGTIFIPKYIKEDLSKKVVIQKVACIILSIIGLIVLVYE